MPKIDVRIGLTLPIDDSTRSYIRPEVGILGIDTDGDVGKQLEEAGQAIHVIFEAGSNQLKEEVVTLISDEVPELRESFNKTLEKLMKEQANIKDVVIQHLKQHSDQPGQVVETPKPKKTAKKTYKKVDKKEVVEPEPEKVEETKEPEPKKVKKVTKKAEESKKAAGRLFTCKICGAEFPTMSEVFQCRKSHGNDEVGSKLG